MTIRCTGAARRFINSYVLADAPKYHQFVNHARRVRTRTPGLTERAPNIAMRLRVSLRMFLLLCTGAGFLVAWAGLVWQRRDNAQANDYSWRQFGNSGEMWIYDHFERRGASIRDRVDLEELIAKPEKCESITFLQIFGTEVFRAFRPRDFPNVKKLALYERGTSTQFIGSAQRVSQLDVYTGRSK